LSNQKNLNTSQNTSIKPPLTNHDATVTLWSRAKPCAVKFLAKASATMSCVCRGINFTILHGAYIYDFFPTVTCRHMFGIRRRECDRILPAWRAGGRSTIKHQYESSVWVVSFCITQNQSQKGHRYKGYHDGIWYLVHEYHGDVIIKLKLAWLSRWMILPPVTFPWLSRSVILPKPSLNQINLSRLIVSLSMRCMMRSTGPAASARKGVRWMSPTRPRKIVSSMSLYVSDEKSHQLDVSCEKSRHLNVTSVVGHLFCLYPVVVWNRSVIYSTTHHGSVFCLSWLVDKVRGKGNTVINSRCLTFFYLLQRTKRVLGGRYEKGTNPTVRGNQ
jgi:hypothetical protein